MKNRGEPKELSGNLLPFNRKREVSRRGFLKGLIGGGAVSIYALNRLNAEIYRDLLAWNQKYIEDEAPDGVYWDAVARHFMFEDDLIMMNNGTVGPMPKTVFNSLMKYFKIQSTNPYDVYNYFPRRVQEVREKVAAFINASPDETIITRNTTEGLNFVANGLDLKAGDEVLMSNLEHPAGIGAWNLKAKNSGITIKEVTVGIPPRDTDEILNAFNDAITPKTRVIFISHTVYITGLIAPLKELSKLAKDKGVLLVADSAHGIGMLDLDMHDMGVDCWASSPYKWMGAPTGVGVLYIKKEVQDRILPTIGSGNWEKMEGARKYETVGQRATPLIFALGEAVDFQDIIGKSRIERRIKTLASYLKQKFSEIPGARVHVPMDPELSGGLTALSIKGVDPQKMVNYAREKYNIVIRTIGREEDNTYGIRVSTNIFVSFKHIDMLLEGLYTLAKHRA